jgi:hypothetical protein
MGTALPCGVAQALAEAAHWCTHHVGIPVAVHRGMVMRTITTSFDLWSTEQLLLVYQRYYGKLDAQARRRIIETARLNGWDRAWRVGVELLAA